MYNMKNITIYNNENEIVVQEDISNLPVFMVGNLISEKYPNYLIKEIWQ